MDLPAGADLGPEVTCADPVEGFARFVPEGPARGLPPRETDPGEYGGACFPSAVGMVASDLDQDGDPDLLFAARDAFPELWRNDGGVLTRVDVSAALEPLLDRAEVGAVGAVDLNGDRLPDVVVASANLLAVSWNQGGLQFADFEPLWAPPEYPRTCFYTFAFGDVDGDGDLDVSLPGGDLLADAEAEFQHAPTIGSPDWLLFNDDGAFDRALELERVGGRSLSLLTVFTDRDNDGDPDIVVSTDRNDLGLAPMAMHRHDGLDEDGLPRLTDDAPTVGFDLNTHGMGLGSADLNDDGVLDYLISDGVASLPTLLSDGQGGWLEAGLALGLIVERPPGVGDDWAGEYDGWE